MYFSFRFWPVEQISANLNPESGILGFGIRNTAQGIRNPLTIRIRNPSFTDKHLESSTWNPESTAGNLESKTVLDSLTLRRLKSQQKASHDQ